MRGGHETGRRPAQRDRGTLVLLAVGLLVAVAGVSFAAGSFLGGSGSSTVGFNGAGFNLRSFGLGQGFGGLGNTGTGSDGSVSGTVQALTSTSMKLQLWDGSTVTIDLTGNPAYHDETSSSASPNPVRVGSTVVVQLDTSALASAAAEATDPDLRAEDVIVTGQ